MGHTTLKLWQDCYIKSSKQAMLEGLSIDLKRPTGRGPRFVILSAGSDQGFVENARLVYPAKKHTDGDLRNGLNPNFHPTSRKTVFIMDNASYHSGKPEKIPISSSKKEEIKIWLTSKGIEYPEKSLKIKLIKINDSVWSKYTTYEVDEKANE
ncbi:hypothetical protein J437_LFUL011701 [Ladona fulva]|uniref:Tc1-like transposase DDE domain-containing protein n=1 Tax=Ladona fulva TaxID=123851 RepID=A0A8K0KRJ8_LADFU|nr:hypothetical protein J437_LFUL011701 [Ladona fulva]